MSQSSDFSAQATMRLEHEHLFRSIPELFQNSTQFSLLHLVFRPCNGCHLSGRPWTLVRTMFSNNKEKKYIPQIKIFTLFCSDAGATCCLMRSALMKPLAPANKPELNK